MMLDMGVLPDQEAFQFQSHGWYQEPFKPLHIQDNTHKEAICTRKTFYVNLNGKKTPKKYAAQGRNISMYVESHEPVSKTQAVPIIMIHGEHHTGQVRCTRVFSQLFRLTVADMAH
jgi:hypothetical protein